MLSVALCTYNGADYIDAQIRSILAQSLLPDEIIVCDDRSTDQTVDIVNAVAAAATIPIRLVKNTEQLGVIRNFEKAIGMCSGDLIALSDQDDIWLPHKLRDSVAALQLAQLAHSEATPILVHTDLQLVDRDERPIASSYRQYQGIAPGTDTPLKQLLLGNTVTGCTIVMNRALRDAATPFPPSVLMHDWWLALMAALSGTIVELPQATMLYRQHGRNVVGASRHREMKLRFDRQAFVAQIALRYDQLNDLGTQGGLSFHADQKRLLDGVLDCLARGGFRRTVWLIRSGVRMNTFKKTIGLLLFTLLGGLKI